MPEWVVEHQIIYLFSISFLAATLIPMGSEWLLVALVHQSDTPLFLVGVASCGNVLGALTTYVIGRYGGDHVSEKILGIKETQRLKAFSYYKKYGAWSLLFSFLPVIGDPLCLIGGIFRVPMALFLPLVFIGKSLRYLFLAWAVSCWPQSF